MRIGSAILFLAALIAGGCLKPAPDSAPATELDVPPPPATAVNLPPTPPAKPVAAAEPADGEEEKVLPADKAPNDAPLRPLKELPTYQLSNLRIGNAGPGPGPKVIVHYERLTGEERGTGPTLVLRTADGNEHATVGGFGPFAAKNKAGDYVVSLGFGRPGSGAPKSLEAYLVHTDRRWEDEDFRPRFKVSNSAVMGDLGRPPQYAREWTEEEAKKLRDAPPVGPAANANRTVGEDTAFVGHTEGLLPPLRYADPAKRPVVGVYYRVGDGEPEKGKKVKCLVHLTPTYDARQPSFGQERVMAKPGYAVGELNLKTNKIVTAAQVVFMKLKPDGTLDPKENYTSKWLGEPGADDKEGKLSGDGRKVIGMHLKHFGTVHAVALVLE